MNSLRKQQGMATILLVLLIGLTVMIITSTVAKSLISNKEANVAAHAQTNVQLMGWSGVSAFREYLLKKYKDTDINDFRQSLLNTGEIQLLNDDTNQRYVTVEVKDVKGCNGLTNNPDGSTGTKCIVIANILSKSGSAQSATTIQAIYDLAADLIKYKSVINFTGQTFMSGTTISGEDPTKPDEYVELNVDGGSLSLQAGFKIQNIKNLTINVKKDKDGKGGNVYIDCLIDACGTRNGAVININAEGYVHIINGGNFGNISSGEWVKLLTNVKAENIKAIGDVTLSLGSKAQNISTDGNISLTEGGYAANLHTNKDVTLRTNVEVSSITTHQGNVNISVSSKVNGNVMAGGNVTMIGTSVVTGDITSGGKVNISSSDVKGSVRAKEFIDLDTFSKIEQSAYAHNQSKQGIGVYKAGVRLSTSWIGGNVYSNGPLRLLDGLIAEDVKGDVYLANFSTSNQNGVVEGFKNAISGKIYEKLTSIPQLSTFPDIPKYDVSETIASIQEAIQNMTFETRVDVRQYRNDANYIFVREYGAARVYLNHLRNESSKITYMYEYDATNNIHKQFAVDASGNKTQIMKIDPENSNSGSRGFYLGKYTLNSKDYVGAICETIHEEQVMTNSLGLRTEHKSGYCTSQIIGYLPRVSLDFNGLDGKDRYIFGWPKDYDYTLPDTWYIRSMDTSTFDNASFAPGILYFEGKLIISGKANLAADSTDSVFTNTFLAEGDIDAIAMSPRIYSPRNITRNPNATDALICSRNLGTTSNTKFSVSPPATTPATLSNKFLTPVNLCQDANTMYKNTNRLPNGTLDTVTIDNKEITKLELGLVALMSNQVVRIGACAQIYGDVLARSNVEGSAACGIGEKNGIFGNISSQGVPPYTSVQQHNTMGAGTNIYIPKNEYKNLNKVDNVNANDFIAIKNADLQWAKYQ